MPYGETLSCQPESRLGILFVHGIVGNCCVFDFLNTDVPSGAEVRYLTLEGHGGDALDFSRTSMSCWKSQVEEAVDEMSASCDRIVGVGHSMGCLLLLGQALRGRLSALVLLNAPMCLRVPYRLLRNSLKVAFGLTGNDPAARAAQERYGVAIDLNPLHYYGWPGRFIELYAEIRRIRQEPLHAIGCPVRAFFAGKDEVVSPDSVKYLSSIHNAHVAVLTTSRHYYYPPEDMEAIAREFRALMVMPDKSRCE